jgi:hypothetical protein
VDLKVAEGKGVGSRLGIGKGKKEVERGGNGNLEGII